MRLSRTAMPPAENVDRLRLARTESIGPVTWRRLMSRFGSAGAALDALPRLMRAGGRTVPAQLASRSEAERELDNVARLGGTFVFLGDPAYPPLLAMLDVAPPCLAVLGDVALLSCRSVAVVGGRNASAIGQRMAAMLAEDLARTIPVVSGLARGVDGAAHEGALRTGRTIAVVAGGLDHPYPPENGPLQGRIVESGAVVSEAPLGTTPQARHFPRRNRIIAGLSLGVVVIEAALRSGSLITARIAQDIGREVFAVPGSPLDPRARGGNDLIRQGAMLVETAADVLENLPSADGTPPVAVAQRDRDQAWQPPPDPSAEDGNAHAAVLGLLSPTPTMVDDLVRRCQFSLPAVMAVLLELELAGRVQTLPGNRVALLPDVA